MYARVGVSCALVVAGCYGGGGTDDAVRLRKVAPAAVSQDAAWRLFDRSASSAYEPDGHPVVVRLDRPAAVWALKVLGSSPYKLSVRAGDGSAVGLPLVDLSRLDAGWHRFESDALVATNELVLTFSAVGGSGAIPELELWEPVDASDPSPSPSEDPTEMDGRLVFGATVPREVLAPGTCRTFEVPLERSPTLFRRAYVAYDATGIERAFSLARTVNGLARQGGELWLAADGAAREFEDEIDPALLLAGANEIQLCAPSDATREVAVTNVRIVGELDRGTRLGIAAVGDDHRDLSSIIDGDPSTSVELSDGERITIALDRAIVPDAIILSAGEVTEVVCVSANRTARALKVSQRALASGRTLVALDGGAHSCTDLTLTFAGSAIVADIDVVGSGARERVDMARLITTSAKEHFGDVAWVSGFVTRPASMPGAIRVELSGQHALGVSGDFAAVLRRSGEPEAAWPVAIQATLPDGTTRMSEIVLGTNQDSPSSAARSSGGAGLSAANAPANRFGPDGGSVVVRAATRTATQVRLRTHVGVDVPPGALAKATNITVRHLGEDDVPMLEPGMINVTAPHRRAYEFLPHGQTFARAVEVTVPYEPTLIPEGMTADDINTYFFDPAAKRWTKLTRVAVDIGERTVKSSTDHFTIMINAVLAVPKNAAPLSFDPTALTAIGAASPAANIDLIAAPAAVSTGDAHVSLPIRLPAARGAYAPALGLTYSSGSGNSWVGVGWNVSSSTISIDTRWGTPTYAQGEEPRYLLDGVALVPTLETEGPTCTGAEHAQRYRARVEGGFAHILRCGDHPSNYRWEVRDRNGTRMEYGERAGAAPDSEVASLRAPVAPSCDPATTDCRRGIFRWHLRSVTDVHGNITEFAYDPHMPVAHARELYLRSIAYTSHANAAAPYVVELVRDDGGRPDPIVDAQAGFVVQTVHLLRAVRVRFLGGIIREYVLTYKHGALEKSVLSSVRVYGAGGCASGGDAFTLPGCTADLFHEHGFDYFDHVDEPMAFGFPIEIPVVDDPDPLAGSLTKGHRRSFGTTRSATLGLDGASLSAGANLTISDRDEQIGLYDVTGDGLPDQLYDHDGTIVALTNQLGATLSAVPVGLTGLTNLGNERYLSWGVDASATAGDAGTGVGASAGFSNSTSRAKRFFADIDGDHFLDLLVADGPSLFGEPQACGNRTCVDFAPRWTYNTPSVIDPRQDALLDRFAGEIGERTFIGDPVVRWVAPYTGTVVVNGVAQKTLQGGTDGVGIELVRSRGVLTDELVSAMTIAPTHDRPVTFAAGTTIDVRTGESLFVRLTTGADEGIAPDGTLRDEVEAHLHVRYTQTCVDGACSPVTELGAREPTGELVFEFDSRDDFRIAGLPEPIVMPFAGTIDVRGLLDKQVTPSDVRICVQVYPRETPKSYLTGTCSDTDEAYRNVGMLTFFANERVTQPFDVTALQVQAGELVVVRVESEFSIDPAAVTLVPRLDGVAPVAYTQVCLPDGTGETCSSNAADIADVPLDVSAFGAYAALPPYPQIGLFEPDRAPPLPFVAPRAGRLRVEAFSSTSSSQIEHYAIRSDRQGLLHSGSCSFGCCGGQPIPTALCQGTFPPFDVTPGESVTIEVLGGMGPSYRTLNGGVRVSYDDAPGVMLGAPLVLTAHLPPTGIPTPFVGGYRGWMYTLWNENESFAPSQLIEDYRVPVHEDGTRLTDDRILQLFRSAQAPVPRLAGAPGTLPTPAWIGAGSTAFASASTLHAARASALGPTGSLGDGGGLYADGYARLSATSSLYRGASLSAGGIDGGATVAFSTTKTTTDALDLDGDGILDVVAGEQRIKGVLGALASVVLPLAVTEGFRERKGHDLSISFGAAAVVPRTTASGRTLAETTEEQPDTGGSVFSSGIGVGVGRSQTTHDLVDLNGDRLPDKVRRADDVNGTSTIYVQYGLGHGFAPEVAAGVLAPEMQASTDTFASTVERVLQLDNTSNALSHDTTITEFDSKSINLGVVGGSVTTRKSTTRTTRQLADISGDGLPDLLVKHDGDPFIRVQLNLGGRFSSTVHRWATPAWAVQTGGDVTVSIPLTHRFDQKVTDLALTGPDVLASTGSQTGRTVAGSVTVPIIPEVLSVGGSQSISTDTDTYEMSLLDFDGDGSADHVLRRQDSSTSSKLYVKHNRVTGKVNLLKTIHGALGASIALDYDRVGNTVEMPQSRYVLRQVVVDDGQDDLPSPNIVTTVAYEGGFHHRLEKEFFGFAKVTATRADGASVVAEYHNRDYSTRGLVAKETRTDGNGLVLQERRFEYEVRDVLDEAGTPILLWDECVKQLHPLLARLRTAGEACTPRFPVVVKEHDRRSEDGLLAKTHTVEDTAHDRFGHVLRSLDRADDAIASDDVVASVEYRHDTSRWILGRPRTIEVLQGSASGTLLRRRAGQYDERGNLIELGVATGTSVGTAVTQLGYDEFGNLRRVETPANAAGQTQTFEIVELDPIARMYPTRTKDGFGHESSASYDLRFGIATSETDINGSTMQRQLDAFGRLASVRGPYDVGPTPGLAITYFHREARPRAVTVSHGSAPSGFGSLEAPDVTTVTIVDGLGRTTQLRKSAVVDGNVGMTTSGLVARDNVGNVITSWHPFFTDGASDQYTPPVTSHPTTMVYDALDRVISTRYPDGATETVDFAIATDPDGRAMFLARHVDPNGNARETYADHAGLTRAFVEHPAPSASSVNRYDYLATGELSRITDAEGNLTTLGYDLRGLRTAFENGDYGLIEDRFDAMGNRVALIEPNHRANSTQVTFVYDRDRLAAIDYPSKPDVIYTYGSPTDGDDRAKHRVGRLELATDETGTVESDYGALGEVTRAKRTVRPWQLPQPDTIFEMRTVTDSLGRQLQLTYPDGEVVTNRYDQGGMLAAVTGASDASGTPVWTRTYVSGLRYDTFGNLTRALYGNGVESTWTFEPARVRLASAVTKLPDASTIQDLHYAYDPASNPLSIENTLGALSGGSGTQPGYSKLDLVYDGVDRLTLATGRADVSHQKKTTYSLSFGYTPSHNLVAKQRAHLLGIGGGTLQQQDKTSFASSYLYQANRPHLPNQIGDLGILYDPSGNPARRQTGGSGPVQVLTWDDDNRLVSFEGDGVFQQNRYDASGLRVRRKSSAGETIFASPYFDLENGTQGVKHVFAGPRRVASSLGRYSSGVIDDAPPLDKQGTAYFFHQDHLGSTSVLTSETGTVHESLEYFVDGETWINRGPLKPTNGYLFSGKPFDRDTGLYDFGQRFYDPRISLWMGADPALGDTPEGAIGMPLVLSATAYAAHSPGRYIDPDGRQPVLGPGMPDPIGSQLSSEWAGIQDTIFAPVRLYESQQVRVAGVAKFATGVALMKFGAALCTASLGLGCGPAAVLTTAGVDLAATGFVEAVTNEPLPTMVGSTFGPEAQAVQEAAGGAAGFAVAMTPGSAGGGLQSSSRSDIVFRAPRPGPYTGPPNSQAARTVGEHLEGGVHLPGSHLESWTGSRAVAEEFARRRGTQVQSLDLSTVPPRRIAADLRTEAGKRAAIEAETDPFRKNLIKSNLDDEVFIWRCVPCE